MQDNDAGAKTVGEYLVYLAWIMWVETDGADGKRPFGNSGWTNEVESALVAAGMIDGEIDEDGYAECDWKEAQTLVAETLADLSQSWGADADPASLNSKIRKKLW